MVDWGYFLYIYSMSIIALDIQNESIRDEIVNFLRKYEAKDIKITSMEENEYRLKSKNKYDFSDISGKMQVNFNPVHEQRKIRDEWQ